MAKDSGYILRKVTTKEKRERTFKEDWWPFGETDVEYVDWVFEDATGNIVPPAGIEASFQAPVGVETPFQGQPLDKTTAIAILRKAGGDKELARRIARQRGFNF